MAVLALAATAYLAGSGSALPTGAFPLAITLVALGFAAEFHSFNQSKEAAGSAALIPFTAAALVAPSVNTVLLVGVADLAVQLLNRRGALKAVFNPAQHALALAGSIAAYRIVGGAPFIELAGVSFWDCVKTQLLPSTLLVGVILLVNSVCVSAVIARSSERKFWRLWLTHLRLSLPTLLVSIVVAFYLAWLSVNLGIIGTAGMALPIIAVRQLYRTTVELATVTQELLELMVAAIEARDAYTSGHSRRVAKASEIIAKAIGLSPAEVERVSVAALLHDVGKIDERFGPILAKEGRLTPEEWEIMKQHPIRGSELVGLLSSLRDIVAPVRHHHENWDGTGYPDGLKAEQIPLASRIIMFADTLDAITTDRPYRKALGMEEARSEFLRFRAKQFDPSICDKVVSSDVWAELYVCFVAEARRMQRAS
ncbi:MAG: HD-GYP domain-containing protein [Gemmatimonadaceae bacterium]|nr:HD-GYP domain-containing protein [Gemmatimonadaceae bacterium]